MSVNCSAFSHRNRVALSERFSIEFILERVKRFLNDLNMKTEKGKDICVHLPCASIKCKTLIFEKNASKSFW